MKALMRTGVALCGLGAAALLVGGVLDVSAAEPWASVGGGAAGLVGLALTLYAALGPRAGASGSQVRAEGERSVVAAGNIGSVTTGDNPSPPAWSRMPPSSSAPAGPVSASSDRLVAAGGDIATASTGDH
ncbi:hypothetical protein [Streptomyces sp. JV178]|uniref:hypothetical protein n=1 Tax=Streptomyces sp. JV178 TaxID=858632 RepID=UPI00211E5073|nr:hypothetical protein [Streptomyces sp. JV178]